VIKQKRSKNLGFIQVSFLLFLDIDECALGIDSCSDDGICDNNIGSYTCRCKAGFSGDGRTCTGIVLISLHLMFFYDEAPKTNKRTNEQANKRIL
jgi:hypothetical protein